MEFNRRNFLKYSGSLAISAGLADIMLQSFASSPNYHSQFDKPAKLIETFKNSICGECSCNCGVSIRLIDGLPVKVDGNKLHPVNRGGLCVRGQASLQMLYNPDRFKGPLKRVGIRGARRSVILLS